MTINKKLLILILGPTATAKTRIAKKLAMKIHGSLINCDASQIYKELEIGVNKTVLNDFSNPYYLFNIKNPNEDYSIQNYQVDSRKAIEDSWKNGYIPIMVGGSILYALSCIRDFKYSKERANYDFLLNLSNQELHNKLKEIDPEEAAKTHFNNRSRVMRALEIYYNEGVSKSEFNKNQNKKYIYENILIIGMTTDKEKLKQIIRSRIEEQFAKGLENEVKNLLSKYDSSNLSMQAIGYKEIILGWKNAKSREEIKETIYKNTYKYVKHQLTFLKKIPNISFIDVDYNDLEINVLNIEKLFWQQK